MKFYTYVHISAFERIDVTANSRDSRVLTSTEFPMGSTNALNTPLLDRHFSNTVSSILLKKQFLIIRFLKRHPFPKKSRQKKKNKKQKQRQDKRPKHINSHLNENSHGKAKTNFQQRQQNKRGQFFIVGKMHSHHYIWKKIIDKWFYINFFFFTIFKRYI